MPLREPPEISKTVPELFGKRTAKNVLVQHFASAVRREMDHVDAGAWKPSLRIFGKEEQPDVARHLVIVDGNGNPHSAEDSGGIGLVAKRALDIVKVFSNLGLPQVFNSDPMRRAVVPRHPNGLFEHRPQPATGFRVHGLRTGPGPVLPRMGTQPCGRATRPTRSRAMIIFWTWLVPSPIWSPITSRRRCSKGMSRV